MVQSAIFVSGINVTNNTGLENMEKQKSVMMFLAASLLSACGSSYYASYLGQISAEGFVAFYNNSKTLFAADVNLYQ